MRFPLPVLKSSGPACSQFPKGSSSVPVHRTVDFHGNFRSIFRSFGRRQNADDEGCTVDASVFTYLIYVLVYLYIRTSVTGVTGYRLQVSIYAHGRLKVKKFQSQIVKSIVFFFILQVEAVKVTHYWNYSVFYIYKLY